MYPFQDPDAARWFLFPEFNGPEHPSEQYEDDWPEEEWPDQELIEDGSEEEF